MTGAVSSSPERITVPEAMRRAASMHANGWDSIAEIQRYLAERGVVRSWTTIKRWAQQSYGTQERERALANQRLRWAVRSGGRVVRRDQSPETKLVRMAALREQAGLTPGSIARLFNFEYGDALTDHQVRYALRHGRYPLRRGSRA